MDPDIAWEEFSSQGSKKVEEVRKGMTSINGKLDALLQLANESNVNSARTAEIVPQVMGDTAAMDAQAAEMAATGGMPPMPPEGVPGGDVPPEAMSGAPPEVPMPEEAPTDVPPEGDVRNEPMPPVDEPAADVGPVPEEPVPDMGAMPQEEPAMGMDGGDMGLGEIDWSAYSIDNAYEDFEEALKDEAKEALDAGDTQRVAAITQVMDAIRMIWAQSGVADEAPVPEMAGQVAPGVDGMPAPDMMKSEGDDMTGMEDATKAELEPIKEETMVEEEVEKADDMGGDIAEGETAGGDAVEGVEASEGCKKSGEELEDTQKGYIDGITLDQALAMAQQNANDPSKMEGLFRDILGMQDRGITLDQAMQFAQQNAGNQQGMKGLFMDMGLTNPVKRKVPDNAPLAAPPESYALPGEGKESYALPGEGKPASTGMMRYDPNTGATTPEPNPNGISPSASVAGHDEYNPYADKVPNKPMTGPAIKSEGTPIPSFKSMMEAREASGRPFDCSADEDMLRGARMGQVYKSENGTFMVINSSRPNVASALGMQAKIEPQDLHKSSAPKIDVNEDDPLRKSLRSDWENYMAYKETDSF